MNLNTIFFMQMFNADGDSFLQEGGVRIVDGSWVDNYVEAVMVTEDGNIMIFWVEDIWGSGTIRYNIITDDGTLAPNGVSGGYVLDNTGDPENLKLLGLSFGESAIVAWEELTQLFKRHLL